MSGGFTAVELIAAATPSTTSRVQKANSCERNQAVQYAISFDRGGTRLSCSSMVGEDLVMMHRPDSKAPPSWTRVAVGLALAISTVSAGACGDDNVHHDNTVVSVKSQIMTTTLAPVSTTSLSPTGHPNLHGSATHVGTDAHDDVVCWDANHNGAHTTGLAALDDNAAAGNWACSGTVGLTAVSDDRDIIAPTLEKWVGVVGLVIAPATSVTALCYYFGYVSTRKSVAYLGIDSDAIGFTTNDYVTKSAGVLFVTILTALVLSTGLLALCACIRRLAKTAKHAGLLRAFGWTVVSVGAVSAIAGVAGVWRPAIWPHQMVWLTPDALALGAGLIVFGAWIVRTTKALRSPLPPWPPLSERSLQSLWGC